VFSAIEKITSIHKGSQSQVKVSREWLNGWKESHQEKVGKVFEFPNT